MANSMIVPMPESHMRLGVALETPTNSSTYGTYTDPNNSPTVGGIYRVLEPKWSEKVDRVNFNEKWDSELSVESHAFRKHKGLDAKHYFYIPRTNNEATAISTYLKTLLLPGKMKSATANNDTTFTIDDDYVDSVASPVCIKRHGSTLVLQEWKEGRKMYGARNNWKLNFDTAKGMLLETAWLGMAYGDGIPVDMSADLYLKPAHLGGVLDFASAGLFICLASDAATTVPTTTYYNVCKGFTLDRGVAPKPFDDCNGANGVSGIHVAPGGAKVEFDVARPIEHGTLGQAIDGHTFPWLGYFHAGDVLYFQMTLLGAGAYATGAGIRIRGCFQLEDDPEQGAADGMRRLKLGGGLRSATIAAATLNGFDIEVFGNVAA